MQKMATTTLPDNATVTVTMTGKQMRALINHIDLTVSGNDLTTLEHGVLYLMGALHQAETLHAAEVSS